MTDFQYLESLSKRLDDLQAAIDNEERRIDVSLTKHDAANVVLDKFEIKYANSLRY